MALGVGVDEAGSIFRRARARRPSPMRLGGLAGCQLTGPVAETPDVDLRRTAASHHQAELGGRCSGGAEANSIFFVKQSSRKKSCDEKDVSLVAGCCGMTTQKKVLPEGAAGRPGRAAEARWWRRGVAMKPRLQSHDLAKASEPPARLAPRPLQPITRTLHRAPVGQGPPGPDWLAISFGFWSGRALATGTAWAGLCLIHHHLQPSTPIIWVTNK